MNKLTVFLGLHNNLINRRDSKLPLKRLFSTELYLLSSKIDNTKQKLHDEGRVKQKPLATYVLQFFGKPKKVGGRNFSLEEIEAIINSMCDALEGIQGIKTKCKRVK